MFPQVRLPFLVENYDEFCFLQNKDTQIGFNKPIYLPKCHNFKVCLKECVNR